MFDCALKRSMLKNNFETTHVGASQVIVRSVTSDVRCVLKSAAGLDIDNIKVRIVPAQACKCRHSCRCSAVIDIVWRTQRAHCSLPT
jgi:hypothetical protein